MSGVKNIQAKQKKWQDPSKFSIAITGAGSGTLGMPEPDTLSMACEGVTLAEFNTTPIEEWIAEEWRFATGRMESIIFSLTLKDYDNFVLYKKFTNAIQEFSRMYPKDQQMNIEVKTSDDFGVTSFEDIVHFKDAMLITVGGATLENNATSSIATFTATFKCSHVKTF